MSLTYGFYNSIDHDRRYDAVQMSSIFDGIIKDGIFESIGDHFAVRASGEGMIVTVGTGRAWFNHTWTLLDSVMQLTVPISEVVLNRIDSVVLEVNAEDDTRANDIKIIKGTPATNPVQPTLTNTERVHQYRLADIYVGKEVKEIFQANITNYIGMSPAPFITGILETIDITSLVAQWQNEWRNWSTTKKEEFMVWLETIKEILDEETVGHLMNLINDLRDDLNGLSSNLNGLSSNLTVNDQPFIFDTHDGEWGWNEKPTRGADTFHPFKQKHTATFQATSRAASIDMGVNHQYRYVNTNSVPNTNSGTYNATTRSSSIDMGATNTYRYVNTSGVPSTKYTGASLIGTGTGTYDINPDYIYIISAGGGGVSCETIMVTNNSVFFRSADSSLVTTISISGSKMTVGGSASWRRIYRITR